MLIGGSDFTNMCIGATLDEVLQPGKPPKINGSVMLVQAETKEEAERILKEDIYTKSDVWDWEKVSVVVLGFSGKTPS